MAGAKALTHVDPHEIPAGAELTLPWPSPATVTHIGYVSEPAWYVPQSAWSSVVLGVSVRLTMSPPAAVAV